MTPNPDIENQPPTPDAPTSRRRLKTLMERLKNHPQLLEQFETILGIAEGGDSQRPLHSADEVESLLVEATRKVGNQTMRHWAQAAHERAVEEARQEHPSARLKKKRR